MTRGTVKWFDAPRGYGYVRTPDGEDVFVHYSVVQTSTKHALREGQAVEFDYEHRARGLCASIVRVKS